ncbi:hypothetical protein Rs2_24083 [Raphanus sativus]|nr:hypothetical protein Rs2_24083 [Raphanus sativus]
MPSTTARAGGIFLPIIESLSLSAGSKPGDSSSRKLGLYLIQSQFQVCSCNVLTHFGALTHYSSGQAAVYYGAGYVDLPDVFKIGFVMATINAIIWGVVGTFWWKFFGLY